jgi:hypothetical protein
MAVFLYSQPCTPNLVAKLTKTSQLLKKQDVESYLKALSNVTIAASQKLYTAIIDTSRSSHQHRRSEKCGSPINCRTVGTITPTNWHVKCT